MTRCSGLLGGLALWTPSRPSDEGEERSAVIVKRAPDASGGQQAVTKRRVLLGGSKQTHPVANVAHMEPRMSVEQSAAAWRVLQSQQQQSQQQQQQTGGADRRTTVASTATGSRAATESTLADCARQSRGRMPRRRALVWFRRDLRLHDNLAVHAALHAAQTEAAARDSDGAMAILPVYIVHRPVRKRCGAVRFQFLLECLQDLRASLARVGSQLLVLRGEAVEVLRVLLPAWGVTDLFFEESPMPYAAERDDGARALAARLGVSVHSFRSATLYDSRAIIAKNGGQVPTRFEDLLRLTEDMPQPAQPLPAPAVVPGAASASRLELFALMSEYCRTLGAEAIQDAYHSVMRMAGADALSVEQAWRGDSSRAALVLFDVPRLEELGLATPPAHPFLTGGETRALQLLDEFCADEARVGLFQKPRTSPALVDRPSTSCLSAYISFGCLSPREFFYRIMFIQLKFPGQKGPPDTTLDGQLMWREFFYCFAAGVPYFDSQEQNAMCRQIAWRLPYERASHGHDAAAGLTVDSAVAMEHLQCWKEGRTGFPWIDAVMRQINAEGWAHHAGRHAVACFLTRGDLYISWLQGAHYFQDVLIDMDWALNVGNWLWVSASCFFRDVHSVHSPSLYVQQWDPTGAYIRKYVPELRAMPTRFVFEPWRAPLSVQHAARCLVGKDYPFPIVDHQNASRKCIEGLSRAPEAASADAATTGPC